VWLPTGTILMATADTPALQYRRRKRRLAIHAALFAIVNGFFVGQWLLALDAPLENADPRALASFWPAWLMLLWGVSNIAFVDLGSRRLRGLEGEWQVFAVSEA
jgi:hypothetical protein